MDLGNCQQGGRSTAKENSVKWLSGRRDRFLLPNFLTQKFYISRDRAGIAAIHAIARYRIFIAHHRYRKIAVVAASPTERNVDISG